MKIDITSNEFIQDLKQYKPCRSGTQSFVGIFKHQSEYIVFKCARTMDQTTLHEQRIMTDLNSLNPIFPAHIELYGHAPIQVNPEVFDIDDDDNLDERLFEAPNVGNKVLHDFIFCECVDQHGDAFGDFLFGKYNTANLCVPIVKQVLVNSYIAQKLVSFTHYDLHTDNIMLTSIPNDTLQLFVFDNTFKILIHPNGDQVKFIDFGYSFSESCVGDYMYQDMTHMECGIYPNQSDHTHDMRTFLTTLSRDIASHTLYKIAKMFSGKGKLDPQTGRGVRWCKDVMELLYYSTRCNQFKTTPFSRGQMCTSFGLLLSIFRNNNQVHTSTTGPSDVFAIFAKQWMMIEETIPKRLTMWVFKSIIVKARELRDSYQSNEVVAVREFQSHILNLYIHHKWFKTPTNVKYDALLCSIYLLGMYVNKTIREEADELLKLKEKRVRRHRYKCFFDWYSVIDTHYPEENLNPTKVYQVQLYNIPQKIFSTHTLKGEQHIDELNHQEGYAKGYLLHTIIKKQAYQEVKDRR